MTGKVSWVPLQPLNQIFTYLLTSGNELALDAEGMLYKGNFDIGLLCL